MKLNSAQVEKTLSQFEAQVIPDEPSDGSEVERIVR